MSSKTVKCVNCNVVINELLTFLSNVLDFMDEESIHQLCTSSFTADDIVKAKTLLFESLATTKKMPIRRKDGKKKMSRDLDDIICLMKATDPDLFPIFVAKELHKLPPVTFDHVDATRLLKDILILQNKCKDLEDRMVTRDQFDVLKFEVQNMKCASLVDNYYCTPNASLVDNYYCTPNTKINKRRGACLENSFTLDSDPIDLQYMPISSTQLTTVTKVNDPVAVDSPSITTDRVKEANSKKSQQRDDSFVKGASESETSKRSTRMSMMFGETKTSGAASVNLSESIIAAAATSTCAAESIESPTIVTFATAVSAGTESSELQTVNSSSMYKSNVSCEQMTAEQNKEWKLVERKSSKSNRLVSQRGCASIEPDIKFRAADVKVPLLISNVSTETQENDIISYIKSKTQESVSLKKINIKSYKKYNAYKVFVSKHKVNVFLNDQLWPDGITFRRFVHFIYRTNSESKVKVS